jgi:hypothetical protein
VSGGYLFTGRRNVRKGTASPRAVGRAAHPVEAGPETLWSESYGQAPDRSIDRAAETFRPVRPSNRYASRITGWLTVA